MLCDRRHNPHVFLLRLLRWLRHRQRVQVRPLTQHADSLVVTLTHRTLTQHLQPQTLNPASCGGSLRGIACACTGTVSSCPTRGRLGMMGSCRSGPPTQMACTPPTMPRGRACSTAISGASVRVSSCFFVELHMSLLASQLPQPFTLLHATPWTPA